MGPPGRALPAGTRAGSGRWPGAQAPFAQVPALLKHVLWLPKLPEPSSAPRGPPMPPSSVPSWFPDLPPTTPCPRLFPRVAADGLQLWPWLPALPLPGVLPPVPLHLGKLSFRAHVQGLLWTHSTLTGSPACWPHVPLGYQLPTTNSCHLSQTAGDPLTSSGGDPTRGSCLFSRIP